MILLLLFIYLTQASSFKLSTDNTVLIVEENIQFNIDNVYEWSLYGQIIESIEFSDAVTKISEASFSNFVNLKQVTIGNNVEIIESKAFSNCKNLEEIKFNDNSKLEEIGVGVFHNNEKIKEITLPINLKRIENRAFEGMKN